MRFAVFSKVRKWSDAAASLPRLSYVAMRFGFAPTGARVVTTLRSEGHQSLHWKVLGDALVDVLRNGGPVLTKLGQILAVRDDVLPKELLLRLEKLYSKQPAMPVRKLRATLAEAYPNGLPFESFDETPLGVGSVGQVHRARLAGEDVIIKLIRPGIAREIERDMNAARVLVETFFPRDGREMLVRSLDELADGFRREIDLTVEADTLEEFRETLRKNKNVYVPKCHRQHSSRHALVMEELKGEPLASFRGREGREGIDAEEVRRVADLALKEILTQVFVEGKFHADPHAGNLLVLADGRLGLIDLGLTGELASGDRKNISRAVRAFIKRDPDALIQALLGFGEVPEGFIYDEFRKDVVDVVTGHKENLKARASGGASGEESLDKFVGSLFKVARKHKVYVPSSATLLIKTLVTIEGVARSINPEINLVTAAMPVVLKSLTPAWLRWDYWTS